MTRVDIHNHIDK